MFPPILIAGLLAAAGLAMLATSPNVKDAILILTRALPASTAAVTTAAGIDTGVTTSRAEQLAAEYLLTAPAVTTSQLPDAKLQTYTIISSSNADMSSPTTHITGAIVQTGAGGAGAAGATYRFKAASDWKRYIGFSITPSASGTGDASGASATLELVA